MRTLIAAFSLTVLAAAPAAAVTYDAFASFTGTNTGGAFTYGVLNDAVATPTFTPYNDTPGCAGLISGTICTSNGNLPAAFKSLTGAHQSGTVLVPADALLLHPGPDAGESSAIVFTAPTSGKYRFDFTAFVADTNPSGVNIVAFSPGFFTLPEATLTAANPTFTGTQTSFVPAGLQIGLAVNYDGVYFDDSTGIKFTVTAVPEPASWALMIAGFGLVGVAARRRTRAVAA